MGATVQEKSILWTDEMLVGIPQIDAQHHRWVMLLNRFIAEVEAGKGSVAAYKCLLDVLDYTAVHFRAEESLLERMGYAFVDDHRRQHQIAIAEIEKINDGDFSPEQMVDFFYSLMPKWILYHICSADRIAFGSLQGKTEVTPKFGDPAA